MGLAGASAIRGYFKSLVSRAILLVLLGFTGNVFAEHSVDPLLTSLQQLPAPAQVRLMSILRDPGFDGSLGADIVGKLLLEFEDTADPITSLMLALLPLASQFSLPPVSNFHVGALSQGNSGALYLGANLEIPGSALGFTVHAEQSAINNALLHGETAITRITVSAPPCGHCRQFLNELDRADDIDIIVRGKPSTKLSMLLPHSFGPANLGIENALFGGDNGGQQCRLKHDDDKLCSEYEHLHYSYAPYSGSLSAVEVKTATRLFSGTYIENAAFNPSLSPVLSALDRMRFSTKEFSEIEEVVLIEAESNTISQEGFTRSIIAEIAPQARVIVRQPGH